MELKVMDCICSAIIFYSKNNKRLSGSKRINSKYYVVGEMVEDGHNMIYHINIGDMIVDPLTKALFTLILRKRTTENDLGWFLWCIG